jgi:WD40 repeat protein
VAYDAFISYAHAGDAGVAVATRDALHRLAKPWYRLRAASVFLDRSSLAAGAPLKATIETALTSARFFSLLASPEAARSEWVQREVEWWVQNRSVERLVLVLVAGDLVWDEEAGDFDWPRTTAVPPSLRGVFPSEPIWVDLRWAQSEQARAHDQPEFRAAIASIASRLHNRPKEDLIGEDVRQHRRALHAAWSAAGVLAMLAVVASIAAYVAVQQRNAAEYQEMLATARALSARAEMLRTTRADELETTALLAAQSLLRQPSPEASHTAHYAINRLPVVVAKVKHSADIVSLAVTTDGRFAASLDRDGVLMVTDLSGGESIIRQMLGARPAAGEQVFSERPKLVFAASGCCLAVQEGGHAAVAFDRPRSNDGTLHLFSVSGGKELAAVKPATPITNFQFSPDGAYLLVSYSDGLVETYSTRDGELHRQLRHADIVLGLAFSHDGRYLATASMDKTAALWSWPEATLLRGLTQTDSVCCVAFSPDDRTLATAVGKTEGIREIEVGDDGLVHNPLRATELEAAGRPPYGITLYDIQDELSEIPTQPIIPLQLDGYARALHFSPDGRYVIAVSLDGLIRTWDGHARFQPRDVRVREDVPAFAPSFKVVATALGADAIRISPLFAGAQGFTLATPAPGMASDHVGVVAFLPDGRSLLTERGVRRLLQIWDLQSGTELVRVVDGPHSAAPLIANASRKLLVARGNEVLVLGTSVLQDIIRLEHANGIKAAAIAPDGGRTVSVGWDHRLIVSDRDGTVLSESRLAHPLLALSDMDQAGQVVVAVDGTRVSPSDLGITDRQIEDIRRQTLLNIDELMQEAPSQEGATVLMLFGPDDSLRTVAEAKHDHRVVDVALSRDGSKFATAGPDGVVVWAATTGQPISRHAQEEKAFRVRFDAAARRLAIRTATKVLVLSLQDARTITRLNAAETVLDTAISPDGRMLACGTSPDSIDIVNIDSGTTLHRVSHAGVIDMLRFTPGADALVAVDRSGEVLVWSTATGELLGTFDRGPVVRAVGFAENGRTVEIAFGDGSVRPRRWRPHDLVAEISRRVTRAMSDAEWNRAAGAAHFLPLVEQDTSISPSAPSASSIRTSP